MRIYLNGRFVPERQAWVSVYDHGFLYGDGVFETLRAYAGRLFRLKDHLRRLKTSAQRLGIPLPGSLDAIQKLLHQTLIVNRLKDGVLRIAITRGPGPIGLDPDLCRRPTLVILPRPFQGYPEQQYRQGLKVAIVSVRRIPPQALDPTIKSANFLNNILARMEAKRKHAEEGLMLTVDGYLCEGSVSNLFLIRRGRVYTPSAESGILVGITRQCVIRMARRLGFSVTEARLRPADLYAADECFLTNTSMEVMPVVTVDGIRIGSGKPGPMTRRLLEAYRTYVRRECRLS